MFNLMLVSHLWGFSYILINPASHVLLDAGNNIAWFFPKFTKQTDLENKRNTKTQYNTRIKNHRNKSNVGGGGGGGGSTISLFF